MALARNTNIPNYGSMTVRATKQGSDADFMGFALYQTDETYAETDDAEELIQQIEDATLTTYDFQFNKPSGVVYYFNLYAIDWALNRSTAVNISISTVRKVTTPGDGFIDDIDIIHRGQKNGALPVTEQWVSNFSVNNNNLLKVGLDF